MNTLDSELKASAWLREDAERQGPLLVQACRFDHGHNAIACYEKRYGISLSEPKHHVNVIRESDTPLHASPDFSADPLDVVLAREALAEALADDDDELLTA